MELSTSKKVTGMVLPYFVKDSFTYDYTKEEIAQIEVTVKDLYQRECYNERARKES